METVIENSSEALLRMSWQAAVLVCLVLLVQWIFRRQLAPRWRYALWLLVVGRLLLPVMPASPVSIFNLAPQPKPTALETAEPPVYRPVPGNAEMVVIPPAAIEAQAPDLSTIPPAPEFSSSPDSVAERPKELSAAEPLPSVSSTVPWVFGMWLAGMVFLASRVLLASLRLQKLVNHLEGITDGPAADLLHRCKMEMGVQRAVQLHESDEISTPALYGFFTPRLLLPSGLKDRFSTNELRFVFLHELAHVKRGDIAMNWLLTALQIVHWFNPFVWFAFARMRADRELACDAMALACAGEQESRSYGATVVKLVEEFSGTTAVPNMTGILEDKTQIEQRLRMILGFRRSSRWPVIAILVIAALGLATLTDAQVEDQSGETALANSPAGIQWEKWSSEAVAAARAEGRPVLVDFTADWCLNCQANRITSIEIEPVKKKLQEMNAVALIGDFTRTNPEISAELRRFQRAGVPLVLLYPADRQKAPIVLPPELTPQVVLNALEQAAGTKAGTLIGGTVFDAYNTPIEGVEVSISRIWRGGESAADRNNPARFTSTKVTTDALGQWSTRDVPSAVLHSIRLGFSHPAFAETNQITAGDMTQLLTDGAWRTVLVPGAQVSGVVWDEAGQPIADATVTFGRRNFSNRQQTKTDEAGQFTLENLALVHSTLGDMEVLTVQADHFSPTVKTIAIPPAGEKIQFTLTPGATIRGKVVDEEGDPIPRVRVSVESSGNAPAISWNSETDSEGRFEWNGAPPKEIQSFYFGRGGYAQLRGVRLKPGAAEQTITLPNTRKVSGRVMDARTGQTVTDFTVLPASGDAERLHSWSDSYQREFKAEGGGFELELTEAEHNVVQIRAEGYLMRNVVLPQATNDQISITARLEPVAALEGYVVNPAGEPVPGAEVVLTGSDNFFYFRLIDARFESHRADAPKTISDETGYFRITPTMQPDGLAVVNQDGFGEITVTEFQRSGLIVLQPWGRIEGRLQIGTEPGAGIEVLLNLTSGARPSTLHLDIERYKATTGANGEFVIERAPPGRREIVRLLQQSPHSWLHTHPVHIEVVAGQTTRIEIGGDGVKAQGRAVEMGTEFNAEEYQLSGTLRTRLPSPREKENYEEWVQSPEAKALFAKVKSFAFTVQPEGTFEIPDVPPGEYRLNISIHEKSGDGIPNPWGTIGTDEIVLIPDGAPAGGIHDLGSFSVKLPRRD